MKKIYRTPSARKLPLICEVNILADSDTSTNRDAQVGQDNTIGYGGGSTGGGGTRAKGSSFIFDDSDEY